MSGFLTGDFDRTGRAGIIIDIGKGKKPGASRNINVNRNDRDRNLETKDRSNINRGPRFSDISNRDKSNKDNARFGNLRESSNPNTRETLNGGMQNVDSRGREV